MEKYYINFYTDENGSNVKGNWKLTEEETVSEKESHLYKNKLGLRWKHTASIDRSKVEQMAKDHGISVADVLECV